jgi:hypothetical protein
MGQRIPQWRRASDPFERRPRAARLPPSNALFLMAELSCKARSSDAA